MRGYSGIPRLKDEEPRFMRNGSIRIGPIFEHRNISSWWSEMRIPTSDRDRVTDKGISNTQGPTLLEIHMYMWEFVIPVDHGIKSRHILRKLLSYTGGILVGTQRFGGRPDRACHFNTSNLSGVRASLWKYSIFRRSEAMFTVLYTCIVISTRTGG